MTPAVRPRASQRATQVRLAGVAMIGGALAALGWWQADAARSAYDLAIAQRAAAEARLVRLGAEVSSTQRHARRYAELAARGQFGPDRRAEWAALVDEIENKRGLQQLHYEFSPQRPMGVAAPAGSSEPNVSLVSSVMKLHMRLPHEGRLVAFLGDLIVAAPALVLVRECRLRRLAEGTGGDDAARLSAECVIEWITLRAPA